MRNVLLFITVLASACLSQEVRFNAKVVKVVDGDTIRVLQNGRRIKVRLYGIDCPEKKQNFGQKARKETKRRVHRKNVQIIKKDKDKYGRTVGLVVLENYSILNHELVEKGLCRWYRRYAPGDKELAKLEKLARDKKLGIWSEANSIAPWEFRRAKRLGRKRGAASSDLH